MDATILTTFFCFVLLVLVILVLNELMILKRKVNAHMDRTDLHSGNLTTILSILQQTEAKLDLIFNNSPPAPGQDEPPSKAVAVSKEDAPDGHMWHYPQVIPQGTYSYSEPVFPKQWGKMFDSDLDIAEDKFGQVPTKVSTTVPKKKAKAPAKKRGRPKKAPKA